MPPKFKRNKLVRWASPDNVSQRQDTETVPTLGAQKLRVYSVYTKIPSQVARKGPAIESTHGNQMSEYHKALEAMDTDEISLHEAASTQNENPANITVRIKAKRYENSVSQAEIFLLLCSPCRQDLPLETWKEDFRQRYLDAILGLDGRGRESLHCSTLGCGTSNPSFRCCDCFGMKLFCRPCILNLHKINPLHRIEVRDNGILRSNLLTHLKEWKQGYFHRQTLKSLGLRVQLGHSSGLCPFKWPGHKHFTVIDSNGLHTVNVDFCGCPQAPPHFEQLLDVGWWPSTPLEPQTAATMSVLKGFHVLSLQGQIASTDFYRSLEQLTSGTGLDQMNVSVKFRSRLFTTHMHTSGPIRTVDDHG
jgi:hypothetical protein